jgi:hypothetical protein
MVFSTHKLASLRLAYFNLPLKALNNQTRLGKLGLVQGYDNLSSMRNENKKTKNEK